MGLLFIAGYEIHSAEACIVCYYANFEEEIPIT